MRMSSAIRTNIISNRPRLLLAVRRRCQWRCGSRNIALANSSMWDRWHSALVTRACIRCMMRVVDPARRRLCQQAMRAASIQTPMEAAPI